MLCHWSHLHVAIKNHEQPQGGAQRVIILRRDPHIVRAGLRFDPASVCTYCCYNLLSRCNK